MNTYLFNNCDIINTKEGIFYPFDINCFYRYLDIPSNIDKEDSILTYFFGEDRSYRRGCPFDNGDIIIEFYFNDLNNGLSIEHHPLSFRGELSSSNLKIKNIFINKHNPEYDCFGKSSNYDNSIKILMDNLSQEIKNKIIYYDTINETEYFQKIPNNSLKKFKKNLVYCGIYSYN